MRIFDCFDKNIWPSFLLFPATNLGVFFFSFTTSNGSFNFDLSWFLQQIILMIIIAAAEELFFRGLLLRELSALPYFTFCQSALIISVLFGCLHILNGFSYATFTYACLQGICAFAVSFNLSAIYFRCKSVVPCIIIHSLINLTTIGIDTNAEKLALSKIEASIFILISIIYFVYAMIIFKEYFSYSKGASD